MLWIEYLHTLAEQVRLRGDTPKHAVCGSHAYRCLLREAAEASLPGALPVLAPPPDSDLHIFGIKVIKDTSLNPTYMAIKYRPGQGLKTWPPSG
ncbi:MAG: hypothetical protein KKE29_20045 [Proteobacteria bacterium]|nr:hypothetical protein [Pseudomonadota bacterium]MBU4576015.1 hypothetical protein [Pseudomonadota bacterium]MBV1715981.1 hypothetical protein [Desulfarculus sp.]